MTIREQPLISIIMPAHNAARFVGEAVRSVLAQTWTRWELLIIDDASTDGTLEAVEEAVAGAPSPDTRIRTVRVERIGSPAGVRNVALRMAQGEFIAFLDADDRYFPDTLARLAAHLEETPRLNAVYGFPRLMDESGKRLPPLPHASPTWENIVTSRSSCQLPALLLRKNVLERVGLFNETLSGVEDFEFYLRLYLHDYDGIACLSEEVYDYRVYAASLTKSPEQAQRLLDSALRILDWLFAESRLPAFVQAYRSRAYAGCYRYLARERLLHGQPVLCRRIVRQARRNPNITPGDFLRQCGPLLLRSFFPTAFDRWLVRVRRQLRECRQGDRTTPLQKASYDTLVIDNLPAFLEIRDAWDAFLTDADIRNLTMTHGWLTAWLRRFPPGELCVIVVRDGDGRWLGAAPLQIERGRSGYGQRLLRYVQFIGTHPTVFDWMDIAIHPQADARAVLAAMAGALRRRRWDALDLYFCPDRSRLETLYRLLTACPSEKALNAAIRETMPMPWLALPDTEPEYLAGRPKRTRANITRCRNLLLKETGHEATLVFHTMSPDSDSGPAGSGDGAAKSLKAGPGKPSGTRALLRRFVEGHIESWGKRNVKSDFKRYPTLESFYADALTQAADAPDERAPVLLFSTLERDGQPMSFHLGFRQGDGYLLHLTHFDRTFERYSPGALHIDATIADVIRGGGRAFNFGRGDEPYKRAWTKATQPLWNLRLFRTPWHRALWDMDAVLKRLSGRAVL